MRPRGRGPDCDAAVDFYAGAAPARRLSGRQPGSCTDDDLVSFAPPSPRPTWSTSRCAPGWHPGRWLGRPRIGGVRVQSDSDCNGDMRCLQSVLTGPTRYCALAAPTPPTVGLGPLLEMIHLQLRNLRGTNSPERGPALAGHELRRLCRSTHGRHVGWQHLLHLRLPRQRRRHPRRFGCHHPAPALPNYRDTLVGRPRV
jgi:hypothetical protein